MIMGNMRYELAIADSVSDLGVRFDRKIILCGSYK